MIDFLAGFFMGGALGALAIILMFDNRDTDKN